MISEIIVKITFGPQNMVITEERTSGLAGMAIPPSPEIMESQVMIPQGVPPVPEDATGLAIEGIAIQPPGFEETFTEVEFIPPLQETASVEKMLTLPLPEEGVDISEDIAPPEL